MTVINGLFAVGSGYPGCGFTRTVYSHAAAARGPRARRSLAATGSRVAPCAQRSRSEHSANTAQGHSVKRHGPEPARPRDGHPRRPRHGPGRPAPSRDHRAPERQLRAPAAPPPPQRAAMYLKIYRPHARGCTRTRRPTRAASSVCYSAAVCLRVVPLTSRRTDRRRRRSPLLKVKYLTRL